MTTNTYDLVENINFREILFKPQLMHKEYLDDYEQTIGDEIEIEFKKAYNIVSRNFNKFDKKDNLNKSYSIVLLSDGLTTLLNVFHSSFIGYAIEGNILLRYYIECMGLCYGIFIDKNLFNIWKYNQKNRNANFFTKKGLKLLYKKYPPVEAIWNNFSKVSHLDYHSTRTTYLRKGEITVGGFHDVNRDTIININIRAAKALLKLTNSIFGGDLKLA